MKKLLIFMLVLGMVSAANATLSATLTGDNTPGSGTVSMYVIPSTDQVDDYMAITIKGTGSLTSVLGPNSPADSSFGATMADMGLNTTLGDGDIWVMTSFAIPSVYPEGVWIIASYTGAVGGTVLTAYESIDGSFEDLPAWDSITIIPEPATIALLGLGGLLLRRRK